MLNVEIKALADRRELLRELRIGRARRLLFEILQASEGRGDHLGVPSDVSLLGAEQKILLSAARVKKVVVEDERQAPEFSRSVGSALLTHQRGVAEEVDGDDSRDADESEQTQA